MKIYTKTGDKGFTSLYGGTKVSKDHIRIDSYGTVDELNSIVGLVRSHDLNNTVDSFLIEVQKQLFTLGAELATPPEKWLLANGQRRLKTVIENTDIQKLEECIDEMDKDLQPLTHFILPGGLLVVSHCHLARTVCRRAERIVVALNQVDEVREEAIMFLNRLSDYFFVLARHQSMLNNHQEFQWIP